MRVYLYYDKGDQKRDTIRRGESVRGNLNGEPSVTYGSDRGQTRQFFLNFEMPSKSIPKGQKLARVVVECDV